MTGRNAVLTVARSAAEVLDTRPGVRAHLGETAYAQFVALVTEPTPAVVASLNSVWVHGGLFVALLNGLLRSVPEQGDFWRAALRAIGQVRPPLRVDNTELINQQADTLEEHRGDV